MDETTQIEQSNIPTVSPLAPDFLLFALPLAALLDIFGFASIFFSFGIAGFIVSFVLGIPFVAWMVIKEGNVESAKEHIERLRTTRARAQEQQMAARRMGRRVARKAGRKVARKIFTKALGKLILGSFLVFFPYWLWLVVSVLRKG